MVSASLLWLGSTDGATCPSRVCAWCSTCRFALFAYLVWILEELNNFLSPLHHVRIIQMHTFWRKCNYGCFGGSTIWVKCTSIHIYVNNCTWFDAYHICQYICTSTYLVYTPSTSIQSMAEIISKAISMITGYWKISEYLGLARHLPAKPAHDIHLTFNIDL